MRWLSKGTVAMLLLTSAFLYVHGSNVSITSGLKEQNNSLSLADNEAVNECDCGEYGVCKFENGQKKCICAPLSIEFEGKCVDCNCGKFSKSCSINTNGTKICNCRSGYVETKGLCTECDCGDNGLCEIESGQKKCICSPSYVEVRGKCQACECGKATYSCTLDSTGKKKCTCLGGYLENNGTCEECYCSRSGSCGFVNGLKKCSCNMYYSERNGTCEYCSCGEKSSYCYFDSDLAQRCDCYKGFADKNGSCEKCDCGYYGSCSFENGRKRCNCTSSSIEIDGRCLFATTALTDESTTESSTFLPTTTTQVPPVRSTLETSTTRSFETISDGTPDFSTMSPIISSTSQDCDCGPRGRCAFENGKKKCMCDKYTSEKDGKCVDCYCGQNSKSCLFNWKGKKTCRCDAGYSQVYGFCYECSCGNNAISCSYTKDGTKECLCDIGYTQINGKCSAVCGENKCLNGKCEIIESGYKCRCDVGFTGQYCEEKVQTKPSKQDLWMIMILFVTLAIFVLLSGMFCFWTRLLSKLSKK